MNDAYNPKLIKRAKELRRDMAKEERKLWYTFLRYLPLKFVRQKVFGLYVLDFYCAEKAVAIELDGSQHYDHKHEAYDTQRNEYLAQFGLTVLRYSNYDIAKHYDQVKADILVKLGLES